MTICDKDERAFRKVVKDAIPNRIQDKLCYSQEDVLSFEGFKRAVLQIDNDYWKRIQDDKKRLQTNQFFQHHLTKPLRTEPSQALGAKERAPRLPSPLRVSFSSLSQRSSISNILEADRRLTPVEWQQQMDLGLCLCCGQSGHLARACPRYSSRPPSSLGACMVQLKTFSEPLRWLKNEEAVPFPPKKSTA